MRPTIDADRGFTLVELAVVMGIVAILVTLALPSMLGFRVRANEARAKADLTHMAKAQSGIAILDGGFTTDAVRLEAMVPGVDVGDATDRSVRVLVGDVAPGDGQQTLMYARAVSGMWFGMRIVGTGPEAGRHTCSSILEADMTLDACTGTDW
jgi:prepilin-type N-terminal cleavage/methylation domain-containing protein